jgi:predicted RNA-binding Zn-ribbon protein involved in translation (DUF1610 family)
MIELARMLVHPYCPRCGEAAMFMRNPCSVDDLVDVECASSRCGWKGLSRLTVPQPKVIIQTFDPGWNIIEAEHHSDDWAV